MRPRHVYRACLDPNCGACQDIAERIATGDEYTPTEREEMADEMADRCERWRDGWWA